MHYEKSAREVVILDEIREMHGERNAYREGDGEGGRHCKREAGRPLRDEQKKGGRDAER